MLMIIWLATALAFTISFRADRRRTIGVLNKSFTSLQALLPILLAMIAFVGLTLAAVPEEVLAHLFSIRSFWGYILVSLAGAVLSIPGPIAFPMAGALLQLGAAPAVLASFITTLTMVGFVTSPIERSYFGTRFVVLRQSFSFIAAIAIGQIMGVLL